VGRIRKIAFWNVAGLRNKDKEFWKGLEEWDIIVLEETWVDEKGWKRVKSSLSKEFNWDVQWAVKRNRRGRAKGGMIMRVRKDLEKRNEEEWSEKEGIIIKRVKIGGE